MFQFIIPIFITHQGCPHRCSFCNQVPVTGTEEHHSQAISGTEVAAEISKWLGRSTNPRAAQVAFYGGSFTGLAEKRQVELLEAVQPFIGKGLVKSIRLSTRPDYISPETPAFLKQYHVDTVEIGVQSLNQGVLNANFRGHTTIDIENSILILKDANLTVGAQLLLGLPGDSSAKAIRSARQLTRIAPDFARLYPALVLKGSALAVMHQKGLYRPLSLPKAIALCSRVKAILEESNIPIIRMGLQPSTELAANVIAGPYHPAFGELVLSRSYFKTIRQKLRTTTIRQINACTRDQSILWGQKKSSFIRLQSLGLLENINFHFTDDLPRGTIEFV
jgi:histone acetyltransferase (RNA polymerase elongator complex component)